MSRVGKKPITLPQGVTVEKIEGGVRVKGPKGTLSERLPESIAYEISDGVITFTRPDEKKESRSLHGLARALVACAAGEPRHGARSAGRCGDRRRAAQPGRLFAADAGDRDGRRDLRRRVAGGSPRR